MSTAPIIAAAKQICRSRTRNGSEQHMHRPEAFGEDACYDLSKARG